MTLAGDAASARVTIEAGGRRLAANVPVGTPAGSHARARGRTVRLRTATASASASCARSGAPRARRSSATTCRSPSGGGRRRHLHRPRARRAAGADPGRPRRQLRAPAAVGRPARRLQRPGDRARDGAPGKAAGMKILLDLALLGLLGRPAEAADPGRVGGPGPADARRHGARLHAGLLDALRAQGTPATWCRSATRSATACSGRPGRSTGAPDAGWDSLGTLLKAGVAGARDAAAARRRG